MTWGWMVWKRQYVPKDLLHWQTQVSSSLSGHLFQIHASAHLPPLSEMHLFCDEEWNRPVPLRMHLRPRGRHIWTDKEEQTQYIASSNPLLQKKFPLDTDQLQTMLIRIPLVYSCWNSYIQSAVAQWVVLVPEDTYLLVYKSFSVHTCTPSLTPMEARHLFVSTLQQVWKQKSC